MNILIIVEDFFVRDELIKYAIYDPNVDFVRKYDSFIRIDKLNADGEIIDVDTAIFHL